jgi:hypothetical protein
LDGPISHGPVRARYERFISRRARRDRRASLARSDTAGIRASVGSDLFADEREVALDLLVGGGLDLLEVLRREGGLAIELVLDRRTDGDLGAGEQALDDAGGDVRGVVPEELEALRAPVREQRQLAAPLEGAAEVERLVVELAVQGRLG